MPLLPSRRNIKTVMYIDTLNRPIFLLKMSFFRIIQVQTSKISTVSVIIILFRHNSSPKSDNKHSKYQEKIYNQNPEVRSQKSESRSQKPESNLTADYADYADS